MAVCGVAAIVLFVTGCGGSGSHPKLAPVHGRVTLDKKPLAGAVVVFHPQANVRESSGVTDKNGEYQLRYLREEMGGAVGPNRVRITKQLTPDPSSQIIPARYNSDTALTAEVQAGGGTHDFDLTSAKE